MSVPDAGRTLNVAAGTARGFLPAAVREADPLAAARGAQLEPAASPIELIPAGRRERVAGDELNAHGTRMARGRTVAQRAAWW